MWRARALPVPQAQAATRAQRARSQDELIGLLVEIAAALFSVLGFVLESLPLLLSVAMLTLLLRTVQRRAAVAAARDMVNGPKTPRNFAQLTTAVTGVKLTALPSTAAMDQAAASLKSAGDASASASVALADANKRVDGFAQLDSMEKAYQSMYDKAKDAYKAVAGKLKGSFFSLATPASVESSNYAGGFNMLGIPKYSNVVWDAYNYSNVTLRNFRDSLGSRADATTAQAVAKKADAAAKAASVAAASKLAAMAKAQGAMAANCLIVTVLPHALQHPGHAVPGDRGKVAAVTV